MVRRWSLIPFLLVVVVAAGCQPPPPPGWVAPTISAIAVAPSPVVAGAPFSVSVTASDDTVVTGITIEIRPPYRLNPVMNDPYPHVECETGPFTPGPLVTVDYTCTLPSFVPNGTWSIEARATDDAATQYVGHRGGEFDVVGGSEDREDPVLVSVEHTPTTPVLGEPFSVTVRVEDEHPRPPAPTRLSYANIVDVQASDPPPRITWYCEDATPTQVTSTLQEWVFTCVIGPDAVTGRYGGFMKVEDAIGHDLPVWLSVDVVAPT